MPETYTKILDRSRLISVLNSKRKKNRIALCHGTFDLMHAGHIKYLQKAKTFADILVVTVTADSFVNKGPGRPIFNQDIRAEYLAALNCIDYVCINHDLTAVEIIKDIKPDFYVKGSDYQNDEDDITGNITKEKNAVKANGGQVVFTNEITFSSSKLLNNHFDIYPPDTRKFLRLFSAKFDSNDIINQINSLNDLKVLIVGDAIIDEYCYVKALGQTGKGNVLAAHYRSKEIFAGGSIAIANHMANFTKNVTLLSAIGDKNKAQEKFIYKSLNKNINPIFFKFNDSETLTKRRYVDDDLNRFFELYIFSEKPNLGDDYPLILKFLEKNLKKYDLVVVADFGNGLIDKKMKEILSINSKFLSVNTQLNSGNRGFNLITQYKRADFISLNEPELRLSTQDKNEAIEKLMSLVQASLSSSYISVTQGTRGVSMLSKNNKGISRIPALSSRVIDRIGAGDAYLSLSSLALAGNLNYEIANFIGSVAAAMDVQIVCNRESIDRVNLFKFITSLLK